MTTMRAPTHAESLADWQIRQPDSTLAEKKYIIASLAISGNSVQKLDISVSNKVNPNTLKYYIARTKKQREILDHVGRHKVIDDAGINNLKTQLISKHIDSEDQLRSMIRMAAKETFERRNPTSQLKARKVKSYISLRSLKRYCHYFQPYIGTRNPMNCTDDNVVNLDNNVL